MTPERKNFNEKWIPMLAAYMRPGELIYDIGKSLAWNYSGCFPKCALKTIDKLKDKKPDVVLNVENYLGGEPKADGIIVMGVTEQCDNPFTLIRKSLFLLREGGLALFGIMLSGYPLQPEDEPDYCRFTAKGALRLLNKYFKEFSFEVFSREGINEPTYLFYIGGKR